MLFQTAVNRQRTPGSFRVAAGRRLFALTVREVRLTVGGPKMPPPRHEFMVTVELRVYDVDQFRPPQ